MSEEKREMDKKISKEKAADVKCSKNEGVQTPEEAKQEVSETWAEQTIADLDEFIESQGIYIRQ